MVDHFLRELKCDGLADSAALDLNALLAHRWPGNVRELRNFVERAVTLRHLGEAEVKPEGSEPTYKEAKAQVTDAFERQFLTSLMLRAKGNPTHAARMAQMDRVNLIKLLRRHGLNRKPDTK